MITKGSVLTALCEFLASDTLQEGIKITPSASLPSLGIDSFALMEALLFLEREFKFRMPIALLNAENTASLESLATAYTNEAHAAGH